MAPNLSTNSACASADFYSRSGSQSVTRPSHGERHGFAIAWLLIALLAVAALVFAVAL